MNEDEAIALYVRRVAELARTMPMREATAFLRGALAVADGHPAMLAVRSTYLAMQASDAQLELIAMGQLKFNLGADGDGHDGGHPQ